MDKQAIKNKIKELEIELKLNDDIEECFLIKLSINHLKELLK
jgi:hypothetical protein